MGNGEDIDFWKSPWVAAIGSLAHWLLPNDVLPSVFTPLSSMVAPNGDWFWSKFEHLLPLPALLHIAAIKAPVQSAFTNSLGWLPSSDSTEPILVVVRRLVHGYRPAGNLSVEQAVHSRSHGHSRVEVRWTCPTEGICSITEAEIWGVVEGLHHAWRLDLRRVWIELDNANVVKLFERRSVRHGYLSLLHHVDRMLEWDWDVCFSYVLHEANSVVDCLAKYGFIVDRGGQVFSHPPDFALNVYLDACRLLSA
ncbi:hypothetical protein V6N11_043053 [Hibiscus sabdariffa]|uniref:RNase H type-1 domain-containing protein n=1 Tax=Hibiscus sabdariffa TaxID=183260 RepID=A0ABR2QYD4_9ROSI